MAKRKLTPEQKQRKNARLRKWRAANPDKRRESDRKTRENRHEQRREGAQQYYRRHAEDPEFVLGNRARVAAWQKANPEKVRQRQRESYAKNSEPWKARSQKWLAQHLEEDREHRRKYAAARLAANRDQINRAKRQFTQPTLKLFTTEEPGGPERPVATL